MTSRPSAPFQRTATAFAAIRARPASSVTITRNAVPECPFLFLSSRSKADDLHADQRSF